MNFIKRFFAPKEIRFVVNALDDFSKLFNSEAYQEIRNQIKEDVLSDYKKVMSKVKDKKTARQSVYYAIAEITADFIETGRYIMDEGMLNPLAGNDLLKIFDTAVDRLLQEGAISEEEITREKAAMREAIDILAQGKEVKS